MNSADNTCSDCKFFDRHGKCRRYPPKVFMICDSGNLKFVRQLPGVYKDEHCGEFKPRYLPVSAPVAVSVGSQ